MFNFMIDTCVWLDLAKDPDQHSLVGVIGELIKMGKLTLVTPRCIIQEFENNRARIARENNQSLRSVIGRVKDAVNKFGDQATKKTTIDQLNNVDFRLPFMGERSVEILDKIGQLLKKGEIIELTDVIKLRAAQRAIDKSAPFHRQRNSINDAIIIETYIECLQQSKIPRSRFVFVTHNKLDFSHPSGNEKMPHPHLSSYFTKVKSLYFINLAEALFRISPGMISDIMIEHEGYIFEQRSYSDILAIESELETKIWYNRHQIRSEKIQAGKIKLISEAELEGANHQTTIVKHIWEGAKKSAKKVEKKYGKKNLVWDDFEWGMINGKLSALRWVMGDEWDSLYT